MSAADDNIQIMERVREHVARYYGKLKILSQESGVSYDLISKINQGRPNITVETAQKLLDHAYRHNGQRRRHDD